MRISHVFAALIGALAGAVLTAVGRVSVSFVAPPAPAHAVVEVSASPRDCALVTVYDSTPAGWRASSEVYEVGLDPVPIADGIAIAAGRCAP